MSTRITLFGSAISAQRHSHTVRGDLLVNATYLNIRCDDGHVFEICVHAPLGATEPLEVEFLADKVET